MSLTINMDVKNSPEAVELLKNDSSTASVENEKSFEVKDLAEFNFLSKQISKIDPSLSYVSRDISKYDFSLVFRNNEKESFSLNGFFKEREASAELNFNYQFQRELIINNKKITKNFSAQVKIINSSFSSSSLSKKTEKEDITKFFQRIIDSVIKMSQNKKKIISGVILKDDDIKELSESGNKEFLQLLYTLIQTIFNNQKLKESFQKTKPKEQILLIPEREISKTITKEKQFSSSSSVSITINEINDDNVEKNEEKNNNK